MKDRKLKSNYASATFYIPMIQSFNIDNGYGAMHNTNRPRTMDYFFPSRSLNGRSEPLKIIST
jgi:hypothetical protein